MFEFSEIKPGKPWQSFKDKLCRYNTDLGRLEIELDTGWKSVIEYIYDKPEKIIPCTD